MPACHSIEWCGDILDEQAAHSDMLLTIMNSAWVEPGEVVMKGSTDPAPQPSAAAPVFDVVAIAASAGGLKALSSLLQDLPADFPAAVVVVQHMDPRHPSMLAEILGRRVPLQVRQAQQGADVRPGVILIAPPNKHLLVTRGLTVSLSDAELVHFVRPSADLLFDSVAAACGPRAVAVVLTGSGTDGALGLNAIKKMHGIVIAQDQATSDFFGMPGAAFGTGCVDEVLPLQAIAPRLRQLAARTPRTPGDHG